MYICDNTVYCVANGGYDADGDSLVYSMAQPLGGPGSPLAYNPGYSATDPFPTAGGHTFDPITGNHCATPTALGQYVVAYDVDEYRAGAWVGRSRREWQLWVINCPVATLDISGTVNDTLGVPVTAGDVELYQYGLNAGGSIMVGSTPVSAGGTYTFTSLPAQQYLVRAIPASAGYPGTANSYHQSTYYWTYADVISSTCDSALIADIQLVSVNNLSGTGYLTGYLGDLGIVRSDGPGAPWEGVGIILERWPERELVAFTRTDIDGHYSFANIPDGTYRVICDHPGLPMRGHYVITIAPGSQTFADLNYAADPLGFWPSDVITDVPDQGGVEIVMVPNPSADGHVTMTGLADGSRELRLFDTAGRKVRHSAVVVKDGSASIDLSHLVAGLYSVVIDGAHAPMKLLKR